jgi:hypothetical protein
MAKGFAHLGLLPALLFAHHGANAATLGSLLISEIMANPAVVSDARGEWFELYNPTGQQFNLRDITIGDDGSDRHRIETDLLISPGHFLTLARNGDPTINGGFAADYVYRNFTLGNSADEIVLRDDAREWLRLEYGPGFAIAGRSRVLDRLTMALAGYVLSPATSVYGQGDAGSPGDAGELAPALSAVPVPAAAWLFGSGLLALVSRRLAADVHAGLPAVRRNPRGRARRSIATGRFYRPEAR